MLSPRVPGAHMAPAALGVLVCAMALEAVIGKRAFVQASVWQQELFNVVTM